MLVVNIRPNAVSLSFLPLLEFGKHVIHARPTRSGTVACARQRRFTINVTSSL